MSTCSEATVSRIVDVLLENIDEIDFLRPEDGEALRYEAQNWAGHGFTPEEVREWVREGYGGLAYLAKAVRVIGLSPRQAGCALADLGHLLRPGYGWDEEDIFLRRASEYKGCCMELP